jgi:hypothetical protein
MKNDDYPELISDDAGDFRPNGILNLSPGLVERGKIKIGEKGAVKTSASGNEFRAPVKLDHFIVTSMERGQDGNFLQDKEIMQSLGGKPKEIPIQLVYDDINLNFPSRYACYIGKTLWCSGDGQKARRANTNESGVLERGHHLVQCPCPRQDPGYTGKDKCKINGTLSVVIMGANVVGGVWKLRTTSFNSVVGILSSLAMIKRITGGRLAGIPLTLKLSPKAVTDPVKGSQQTIYVVSVEYRGSIQELRNAGYQALREDKEHGIKIELLEDQARTMLAERRDEYEDDADDVVAEFFPEQAAAAAGVPLAGQTDLVTQTSHSRTFVGIPGSPEIDESMAKEIEKTHADIVARAKGAIDVDVVFDEPDSSLQKTKQPATTAQPKKEPKTEEKKQEPSIQQPDDGFDPFDQF